MLLLGFTAAIPLNAQTQKPNLPNPIKFINKFDVVANVVREVLENMDYKIEIEDRKAGRIVNQTVRVHNRISDAERSSKKWQSSTNAITGSLLKAHYSVEALLEIVSPTETLVTVHTNMEALSKEVDGTEKWVPPRLTGNLRKTHSGQNKRNADEQQAC